MEQLVKIILNVDKIIRKKGDELTGYINECGKDSYEFRLTSGRLLFALDLNEFTILEYVNTKKEILKELISNGHFIKNISIKKPVFADYKVEIVDELAKFIGTKEQYAEFEKYKEKEINIRFQRDSLNYFQEIIRSSTLKQQIEECFETIDHPKKDLYWKLITDLTFINSGVLSSIDQHRLLHQYEEYLELIK